MPFLKRDGGEVFYDVMGDGEPVVILRGLGRSVRHWLGYEKELAKHAKVIVMDLRGVGRTTMPWTFTTSVFDIADDIEGVLDALKLEQAHIFGVSLGGMVVLAMGLRHPGRCKSLIAVNTSVAGQFVPRISPAAVSTLVRGLFDKAGMQERLVGVLVGPGCGADRRREIAARYSEIAAQDGLYGPTVVRQLVSASRFFVLPQLAKLDVRTLVVYGTRDRFVPVKNSIKLAKRLPRVELFALEGAGHEPTLDQGDALTKLVKDWVSRAAIA